MRNVLSIDSLSKHYGATAAVSNLSLSIEQGQVYGILGPNGSGKTTTLAMILGVVRPSQGRFLWFGEKPAARLRRRIGAILERPNFCPWLTAEGNLKVVAAIRGLAKPKPAIDEALALVKLEEVRRIPFQNYSLGMKQRLAIAAALLGQPDVLVLDEPTNGVDAAGIAEIRQAIQTIAGQGRTILLASHILDEVEKVCSHVAVLKNGRKIDDGAISVVLAQSDVIEVAADEMDRLGLALAELQGLQAAIKEVERHHKLFHLKVEPSFSVSSLNKCLFERGLVASHLSRQKPSLEAHFLELLEKSQ